MTLLDRFFAQSRDKHADPAVRLAFVADIPLEEREAIAAIARTDEDARVRGAAVAKLMDPASLGAIAQSDGDETVRGQASAMLRDIALEAFEGVSESESLEAVDALTDSRALAQIAKASTRDIVALRAVSRISEPHLLGSIARHGASDAARRHAFDSVRADRGEMMAVAMNSEHKDTAVAAVDSVTDRADLEQIAARSRNKSAVKRARAILREADEAAVRAAAEQAAADAEARAAEAERAARAAAAARVHHAGEAAVPDAPAASGDGTHAGELAADSHSDHEAAARTEAEAAASAAAAAAAAEARRTRLSEIVGEAETAAAEPDLAAARRRLAAARRAWSDAAAGGMDDEPSARLAAAEAQVHARDAESREAEARARREGLARLHHLLARVEPLAGKQDLTLKAGERALRDLRAALAAVPPLPSRHDYEEVSGRLKAALAALTPRVQELRDADDWQRWANVTVQEQLCARMEALRAEEDPEKIARAVRELQQQWRQAADVPRAKADALWRRFKAAHDEVWARCEAHFAAQARERAENLARKLALCERAEALADSTNWLQTAEEIKKLQAEWKTIGPVSRGREKATWERFRSACDRFFTRRHEDLAHRKALWAENLAKKDALCARAEALAESTDWEAAAAEIRRLQAEWKTIGPVKKSRSEAIWTRFRAACDRFFLRYSHRHDTARAERVAAREAVCADAEALAAADTAPPDLAATVRALRGRWQQEIAARGVDPDRAKALDERFAAAMAAVLQRHPDAFAGTELDPNANRKRMESLVRRMEDLSVSIAGPASAGGDAITSADRLAAMLKEALAANTIGGKVDDDSRLRGALEEVRQAQASWSRLGPVPEEIRGALADRFQRAVRQITERAGRAGRAGQTGQAGRGR